mmetsp:Transcript_15614/g.45649  ORF Transcript_15614/g.45649 Transcript_15614/m.45649 type:complete len:170 (+) Transcript_15614:143-652(+)
MKFNNPFALSPTLPASVHNNHHHDHDHSGWHEFIHGGVNMTNMAGAILLLVAVILTIVNTAALLVATLTGARARLICPFDRHLDGGELNLTTVRITLGTLVSFALQLLVVADVLDTLAVPVDQLELQMLYKLGLVVVVREVLAYMTNLEVTHLQHELHDAHGHSDKKKH